MAKRQLSIAVERWPIAGTFRISRGSKTEAVVVVVRLRQGEREGWGECVPYRHFGESIEATVATIEALRGALESGLDRAALQQQLPAGAARNAIDCALWDLEAQLLRTPVWRLAQLAEPAPLITAFTLSLDSLEAMAAAAANHQELPLLKIKLGDDQVLPRLRAIRQAAPDSRLLVDANEGWTAAQLQRWLPELARLAVVAIEQPLPANDDDSLQGMAREVPICADEAFRDRASLPALVGRYDMVNIKLDKSGGLTEALALRQAARAAGLQVMVGCMASTSLSVAPAMLLATDAAIVDLDGGMLLARDRQGGVSYRNGEMQPEPALWGVPR